MKVGDLVTWKDDKNPQDVGIVTEIEDAGGVTFQVWIAWNFLNGAEGRNFSFDLEVISENR